MQSLFVIEGALKKNFDKDRDIYIEIAKTIENDIYVDHLIAMGVTFCTREGFQETS